MRFFSVLSFFTLSISIFSAQHDKILLWPNGAPGENKGVIGKEKILPKKNNSDVVRLANVTEPTIQYFPATKSPSSRCAVLVCPGGGYNILAIKHEGVDVCKWLNSIGVNAILLKYRVPRRKNRLKHQAPLEDAQRAIGIIRKNADKWNIDPNKVGVLGFSAGGNLAVMTAISNDSRTYEKVDISDNFSCRPDFAILIYPAYLVDRNDPTELFPEIKVTSKCPPCFFVHTGDDNVPAEGSALLYLKLEELGVEGNELHIFPFGGHGYGIVKSKKSVSTWPARAEEWMKALNLLTK